MTLKCVSELGGTLCMWDSLRTSRWCSGANAAVSFSVMVAATGKLDAGDVLIVFRAVRLILLRTSDETSRLELSMVY